MLLILLASTLASCGDGGAPTTSADVPRTIIELEETDAIVAGLTDFGWDMQRQLATDDENVVFSPHSIAVALAMARAGAVGKTASEIDEVLNLAGIDQVHQSMNAVDLAVTSAAGEVQRPDGSTAEVTIEIANAVWAQDGFGFEEPFLTTLGENYGAGVRLVDYETDHEQARTQINTWVAEQTRDRIEELLAPGVVSALTRMVLTNAVYLKAPWEHPFDEQATTTAPFAKLDGSNPPVELMSVSESLRYARLENLQAVEIPYAGGELAMLVVVPDSGDFESVASALDAEQTNAVVGRLGPTQVQLRFPTFEYSTLAPLVSALRSLGMNTAFDADSADFSAMTTEAPLFVSDVVHQAFISVDEAGTEAAAATAVVMDLTAAPVEAVELTIDRPFLFAIRHLDTGAPLFFGQVVDPAAS